MKGDRPAHGKAALRTLEERTTTLDLAADFPDADAGGLARRRRRRAGRRGRRLAAPGDVDGPVVEPIYPRATAGPHHGRPAAGRWLVEQETRLEDPAAANRAILQGLANGQTALRLLAGPELTLARLETALAGVDLARQPVSIEAGAAGAAAPALLAALAERRSTPLDRLQGVVGGDPLAELSARGELSHPVEAAWDALAEAANWARLHAPALRIALIDGRPYHEAGASMAEELGCLIAAAAETLRALLARGFEPDRAADLFAFSMAVSSDLPLEIAKLRAARSLWALTVKAFAGIQAVRPMALHVSTGLRELTAIEAKSNLVRTALQAVAAAVGGCDSLSVTPFDAPLGPASELGERLARNQQLLLLEESALGRVADPLGGSGAIEALTDQLARQAWERAQAIEAAGGLLAALREGSIQQRIAADAARRREQARIVGVTQFRDASQPTPSAGRSAEGRPAQRRADSAAMAPLEAGDFSAMITAARGGASLGAIAATLEGAGPGVRIQPLGIARTAAAFEGGQ